MQNQLLATRKKAEVLLGKSWVNVRNEVLKLISSNYQLISIVGRAGSGKTHLALNLHHYLSNNGYVCLYTDTALSNDRDISAVVNSLVNDNLEVIVQLLRNARKLKIKNKMLKIMTKLSRSELCEFSRLKPLQFIKYLHDMVVTIGFNGLILIIDEGILSQDFEKTREFISTVHAFRNLLPQLKHFIVIITMLPDAIDYIAKIDAPLSEILNLGITLLPDYVSEEDLKDVAKVRNLNNDEVDYLLKLGNLTMRQVVCLTINGVNLNSLRKCGIHEIQINIIE